MDMFKDVNGRLNHSLFRYENVWWLSKWLIRSKRQTDFYDNSEEKHLYDMLNSFDKKMKESTMRSLSVLHQKAEKTAHHLELVEKRKKEHEEELLQERLRTFEKSLEKQK